MQTEPKIESTIIGNYLCFTFLVEVLLIIILSTIWVKIRPRPEYIKIFPKDLESSSNIGNIMVSEACEMFKLSTVIPMLGNTKNTVPSTASNAPLSRNTLLMRSFFDGFSKKLTTNNTELTITNKIGSCLAKRYHLGISLEVAIIDCV